METNSTASLSYLLSMYSSASQTNSSLSTNTSSMYSLYSQKNYSNLLKINKTKSSKMSTTSKWLSTKLRTTKSSCVRNNDVAAPKPSLFSIKPKLKSRITKKFSLRLATTTPKNANAHGQSVSDTFGLDSLFNVDKNLEHKYGDKWMFSTLHKLMDKPLGWLKIKTKTNKSLNKKSNLRRKSTTNFTALVNRPVLPITRQYLLTAPSMASSFNYELARSDNILNDTPLAERQLHSTPQSQVYNQFSPILSVSSRMSRYSRSNVSQSASTPIISPQASQKNKSIFSATPSFSRRLSFGVTSSPKPINCNSMSCRSNSETSYNGCQNSDNTKYYYNEHQQKLIDHLNTIKQSVKMGVELRNLKTNSNSSFKEWASKNTLKENGVVMSKRKKLQRIFQIKLKRQLREMKKWQVGIKSDFELEPDFNQNMGVVDCFNSNILRSSNFFRNSTNNSFSLLSCGDNNSASRVVQHNSSSECNCDLRLERDEPNIFLIQNSNFNFINCVTNNYFSVE